MGGNRRARRIEQRRRPRRRGQADPVSARPTDGDGPGRSLIARLWPAPEHSGVPRRAKAQLRRQCCAPSIAWQRQPYTQQRQMADRVLVQVARCTYPIPAIPHCQTAGSGFGRISGRSFRSPGSVSASRDPRPGHWAGVSGHAARSPPLSISAIRQNPAVSELRDAPGRPLGHDFRGRRE